MKVLAKLACGVMLAVSGVAAADTSYPDRPVRFVVPWPPGGLSDTISRLVAEKLSETWKQPVVIDNRPGANGIIGTTLVARSKPDGYTLLNSNTDTDTLNPLLYHSVSYSPDRDLVPVSNMVTQPMVLVTSLGYEPRTLSEVLTDARNKPGQLAFASWGNGSVSHLAMELLEKAAGVNMVHVPYKGVAAAVTDVMSGHVPMMFSGSATAIQLGAARKVRVVAVAAKERLPQLPNVPTLSELGYKRRFQVRSATPLSY